MAHAIVIVGDDEPRFRRDAELMAGYLEELGIRDVDVISACIMDPGELESALSLGLCRRSRERLLLLYAGHGVRGAWSTTTEGRFAYRRLAAMIASRPAPVLFINACCHAASAATALEMAGGMASRVSLIAASPAGKVSYNGMVRRIVESWRSGTPYAPRTCDGKSEYIGIIRHSQPIVRTGTAKDGRPVRIIDLRSRDPWLLRAWDGLRVAWFQLFPHVDAWAVVDERRWGAVLDHAFIRERSE